MSSVETHEPAPSPPDDTLLLHQFDDLEQQTLSATLGMWTFLSGSASPCWTFPR